MALSHSPRIVTNGLVLCLDAANQKSFGPISVEYLIVAGGGGGANGGAGAGGLLTGFTTATPQPYTITVGAGGAGAPSFQPSRPEAGDGGNSVAFGLTAIGGGGGGRVGNVGRNGGSGGGGGADSGTLRLGGTGVAGQGNAGGLNSTDRGSPYPTGGGGGASAAGAPGTGTSVPGSGGIGILSSISGVATFYAGGGGGSLYSGSVGAAGGDGGGGSGGTTGLGQPGVQNTGGGAGGTRGDITGGPGPIGGSGIVVIRYAGAQKATGGTVTSVNGDTVHTFTASGTFTPNIMTNLSGNGNNGTLVNGVGYSSADKGSLVFDGVNDYATIPFNSNFNVTSNPFTVIVWNKKNTTTNGFNGLITADLAGDSTWKIYKDNNEAFYKSRAGSMTGLSFPGYTVNQWHQYAFTKSGTSLINYFDGQPVNNTASATNPISFSNDLALGSYRLNDAIAGIYLMDQNFSQILFYNRALTTQEIQQNFNALRGRFGI
jgi:hypothetical protein